MSFDYIVFLLPSIPFFLAMYILIRKGDIKYVAVGLAVAIFLTLQQMVVWEMGMSKALYRIDSNLFKIQLEAIKNGGKIKY
ncbi:hypothetical protein [Chamaesiphon polymorphus]|uniref:Uncharacterized protein n=1 Tax=Chamaesiphon polymorphus CCALA 037 TaxID=2107692 RepID=A0A2T1GL60_9CYAN|nr:hypothetical protein [Chamaesiphon polymorphus]PSB58556.1 hypothetical protein C7B77_04350 [Chamaesiphon polymorphus CCALA 037]